MQELKGNVKCPCGTGKRYASCCKKKIMWVADQEGRTYKRIPLNSEAMKTLDSAEQSYFKVFERSPEKNDPVFLGKYLSSEHDSIRAISETLEKIEINPEFIYAFKKTGRLLTEDNMQFLTEADRLEWEAAVAEYEDYKNLTPSLIEELFQDFSTEYESCLIYLGYFLEHEGHQNSNNSESDEEFITVDDYVILCTTRSINTLRSIKALVDQGMGADALALCRNILENYLHIVFVISKPSELPSLVEAKAGLKLETHEFSKKPNGKTDARTIIRKSDGAIFRGHISNYELASSSPHIHDVEVFDYFYSFLSEYTHPSLSGMDHIIDSNGVPDPLLNKSSSEAIFYAICFATIILNQLQYVSFTSKKSKKDIAVITKRICTKAIKIIDEMYIDKDTPEAFKSLKERLSLISTEKK